MNVLLLNPDPCAAARAARRHRRAWPPLDLLTTAALLREDGHAVRLIDARAARAPLPAIQREADRADLILLQTSPLDRWQCPDLTLDGLWPLARALPRDRLILAGAHGTLRPEYMLKESGALALIRGEPESVFPDLVRANGRPQGIAGCSYFEGGTVIHEPDAAPVSLDDLPAPAYDLIDLSGYGYELLGPRLALLETSRGCPFSCRFCLKTMYGKGIRTKSLARVLAEVEEAVDRRGAESVYFIDLEFTLHREQTLALCRELKSRKRSFRWCCQTRADAVDEELLRAMKAAGCDLIHFGVETGSKRLLEAMNKKIGLAQIQKAMDLCRRIGLETACFFLFGLPGETAADRRATVSLARRLNPTYASFHVAAPYPGTGIADGFAGEEPFPACLGGPEAMVRLGRSVRRAFLSFYLRPAYLRSHLAQGSIGQTWQRLKLFWEFIG